jgi:hypothetical protein
LGGFNLKIGIKCFIALVMAAMTSFCVSASDTTTKFQTGPFTGSIDLGEHCDNIYIEEPTHGELLSGDNNYTGYLLNFCDVIISFARYDFPVLDLNEGHGTEGIRIDLLRQGADKETISVFERKIDGKPGGVGSGYVPKYGIDLYEAGFYVSSSTVCHIDIWENESQMIAALKTINVTEAA